jgi:hypothetical protein
VACGGPAGNTSNFGAYRIPTATGTFTYNPTISARSKWEDFAVAYKRSAPQPGTPAWVGSGISVGGGQATLTWNKPAGSPTPDFYRIYRCTPNGANCTDYTNRRDTTGVNNGAATLSWVDTSTGGVAHDYYITAVSSTLVESNFSTKVTG